MGEFILSLVGAGAGINGRKRYCTRADRRGRTRVGYSNVDIAQGFIAATSKVNIVEEGERVRWLFLWSGRHGREQCLAEVQYTGSSLGDLLPP